MAPNANANGGTNERTPETCFGQNELRRGNVLPEFLCAAAAAVIAVGVGLTRALRSFFRYKGTVVQGGLPDYREERRGGRISSSTYVASPCPPSDPPPPSPPSAHHQRSFLTKEIVYHRALEKENKREDGATYFVSVNHTAQQERTDSSAGGSDIASAASSSPGNATQQELPGLTYEFCSGRESGPLRCHPGLADGVTITNTHAYDRSSLPMLGRPCIGRMGKWSGWVHTVPAIIYLAVPPSPACPPACQSDRSLEGRGNDRLSTPTFPLPFRRRRGGGAEYGRSVPWIQCMQSRPTLSLSLSLSQPRGLDFATRDPLLPPSLLLLSDLHSVRGAAFHQGSGRPRPCSFPRLFS